MKLRPDREQEKVRILFLGTAASTQYDTISIHFHKNDSEQTKEKLLILQSSIGKMKLMLDKKHKNLKKLADVTIKLDGHYGF